MYESLIACSLLSGVKLHGNLYCMASMLGSGFSSTYDIQAYKSLLTNHHVITPSQLSNFCFCVLVVLIG